jgi:hypothetical protein
MQDLCTSVLIHKCEQKRGVKRPLVRLRRLYRRTKQGVDAASWVSSCSAPTQAPVVVQDVYSYGLWRGEVGTATFVYSPLNDNRKVHCRAAEDRKKCKPMYSFIPPYPNRKHLVATLPIKGMYYQEMDLVLFIT